MAKPTFGEMVKAQRTPLPPVKHIDLQDRTVVVIGANIGLGFESAKYFARMKPAHLVLACRNKGKGEAAIESMKRFPVTVSATCAEHIIIVAIRTETGFTAELLIIDLSNFTSVTAFATSFLAKYDRLDILLCNAGMSTEDYETTKDGWEIKLGSQLTCTLVVMLNLILVFKLTTLRRLCFLFCLYR
jgi:retinol dehydrogenase-12